MGLYISAAGILNAQRRNAVTANNVANLRTPGYRAARAHSTENPGGGASVASVSRSGAQGPIEMTGRPLDAAAPGAFFRVQQPDGSFAYTQDGHFGLNAQGQVVNSAGMPVDPRITAPENASSIAVALDGTVYATVPGEAAPQALGQIETFQFTNPGGLEALGGNLFAATAASGPAQAGQAPVLSGALTGSNVNLVVENTNAVADSNAFTANVNAFKAQDEMLGNLLDIVS